MKLVNVIAYEEDGKKVASFRLTTEQIEFLKTQENASEIIRQAIKEEMNKRQQKEENAKTLEKLVNIASKYGICNPPKWNKLEQYTGETFYPTWIAPRPEGKKPSPQYYFEYVLCNEKPITKEETDFLTTLDNINVLNRQQMIRQALERALEKTEIRKGYPLLQFVVDHICPDLAKVESYLHTKPIKDKFTIHELAGKAKIPYHRFYHEVLPKLKQILEWYGWQHILKE